MPIMSDELLLNDDRADSLEQIAACRLHRRAECRPGLRKDLRRSRLSSLTQAKIDAK